MHTLLLLLHPLRDYPVVVAKAADESVEHDVRDQKSRNYS